MPDDPLDDVTIDIADAVVPDDESRHLLKHRLRGPQFTPFSQVSFERRYPAPRRLDIGAGFVRERGWIALDVDSRTSPDILMDAQSLLVPDNAISEARMVSSLGCFLSPVRALREAWRVLVPDAVLTVTEPYAFSAESLPHTKNHLSLVFWHDVTRDHVTEYVPPNASGRWALAGYKRDVHRNMIDQVCRKLKFTEEQAISLMPGLVKRQVVVLRKTVL